jgi:hypothetical protein
MATRFYFQAGSTPSISPAFDTGWTTTVGMTRLKMHITKASTALTDYTTTTNPFGGSYSGIVQLISNPLNGAQTVTASSVRPPILRVRNNSGLLDKELTYIIRVCSLDGSTFRGTALAFEYHDGAVFSGSYTSRVPGLNTMTSVAASDGDRIVLEIGVRNNADGASSNSIQIGDVASSDLGTSAGETNDYNPWCEFGAITLSFQGEAHLKTISNTINAFGPAPTTKWGSGQPMTWGSSKWGEGTIDLQTDVLKSLSEIITLSDALTGAAEFNRSFQETLSTSFEGVDQTLTDPAGYNRLFPGSVTDGDERVETEYTEGTAASTSWSEPSEPSTDWSEA